MDIDIDRLSTCSNDSKNKDSKGFRYVFKSMVKQEEYEHSNYSESVLYGVLMNPYLQKINQYIFAAVGKNRASIYECEPNGSILLKQTYKDCCTKENYYCCCWSFVANSQKQATDHLLIIGGANGVIRILNILQMKCIKELKGHGNSINELKTHPKDPNLLLSISKDHSLRLWNIKTETCVAILGGVEGHRDEVLSADFHLSSKWVVSVGMDHALKIWRIDSEKVRQAILDSCKYNSNRDKKPFKTAKVTFPIFTTRSIHRNYVDSVCWYGNFLLSKSCENAIVLWKPGKLENVNDIELPKNYSTDQTATILHKFECKDNEIWFIRLSMDQRQRFLAVGNQVGVIYVWRIDEEDPTKSKCV